MESTTKTCANGQSARIVMQFTTLEGDCCPVTGATAIHGARDKPLARAWARDWAGPAMAGQRSTQRCQQRPRLLDTMAGGPNSASLSALTLALALRR